MVLLQVQGKDDRNRNKVVYLEIEGTQPGLICPKCGTKYISEETVVDTLARGEKMIEEK